MSYGCIITTTGAAKLAAAESGGAPLVFADMAFGDGNGAPAALDPARVALVNEVHRVDLSSVARPASNPAQIRFRGIAAPEVGGFTIREAGVFDADGDLIIYGAVPDLAKHALPGTTHDAVVQLVAEISPTANVTVMIDPSLVLATLDDVDERVAAAFRADRPHRYYRNGA